MMTDAIFNFWWLRKVSTIRSPHNAYTNFEQFVCPLLELNKIRSNQVDMLANNILKKKKKKEYASY